MKLTGDVLKPFNDTQDNLKSYKPKDEYTPADKYTAEKERYEDLYRKGYVTKGKVVEEKEKVGMLQKKLDNDIIE